MKELELNNSVFESIKHIDPYGNEYWLARELMKTLEYKEWRKFDKVIKKAMDACTGSNYYTLDHFVFEDKMVNIGSNTIRKIQDYKLSRYACYLIVQNCNPRIKIISLAQTYFAIQTRKQELLEEYEMLSEDNKRIQIRKKVRSGNRTLNRTAVNVGVRNLDKFHNAGYKGLYGGETADDIAKRKGLRYREDILDNMGSDELAANLFRISQTNQKIVKDKVSGEINACNTEV